MDGSQWFPASNHFNFIVVLFFPKFIEIPFRSPGHPSILPCSSVNATTTTKNHLASCQGSVSLAPRNSAIPLHGATPGLCRIGRGWACFYPPMEQSRRQIELLEQKWNFWLNLSNSLIELLIQLNWKKNKWPPPFPADWSCQTHHPTPSAPGRGSSLLST